MDMINAAALTPRTLLMLFIAVGAAYFMFKATKHLLFGIGFFLVAVGGVGYLTGVISPNQVRAMADAAAAKAEGKLESASNKAPKIGEMGHSTPAGSASETNEHYKGNIHK